MIKMHKQWLVLMVALIMLLVAVAMPVRANATNGLTISASNGGISEDNTDSAKFKVSATGYVFGTRSHNSTITIKNDTGSKATITFKFSITAEGGSAVINGVEITGNSAKVTLEKGGTFTIDMKCTSPKIGTSYAELSITDIQITKILESAQVAVLYDDTIGTVKNGSTVVNNEGTITTTLAAPVTLTASPANKFVAWVDADNNFLSDKASYTIQPTTENMTAKAIFSDGTPWFYVNDRTLLVEGWDAAMAKGGTIVLANNATLTARETAYNVPSNANLLIPFGTSDVGCFGAIPDTNLQHSTANPSTYRTLTVADGAQITVSGKMNVNGQRNTATQGKNGTGTAKGGHGLVVLEGTAGATQITVNNGGKLTCYGFIKGTGRVVLENGGSLHELMQVYDWGGGSNLSGWYLKMGGKEQQTLFFLGHYYVQNVEAPLTVNYGGIMYVEGVMSVSNIPIVSSAKIVSYDSGEGLFLLQSGNYLERTYSSATDRVEYHLRGTGNVNFGSIKVKVKVLMEVELDSASYTLPLNNAMTVRIGDKVTMNMGNRIAMMPDSQVIVEKDAKLNLTNHVYIFDKEDKTSALFFEGRLAPAYTAGRGTDAKITALTNSARVEVNGELNMTGNGAIYTTNGHSNPDKAVYGTGTIVHKGTLDKGTLRGGYNDSFPSVSVTNGLAYLAGYDGLTAFKSDTTNGITYHGMGADHGNLWYETMEEVEANCVSDAYTLYNTTGGSEEGYRIYQEGTLDKNKHTAADPVDKNVTEPTCTVAGSHDEVVYCSDCGTEMSRETVTDAATGHTEAAAVKKNEQAATCTINGSYDSVVYCSVCNAELSRETVTVDPLGHTEVVDAAKAPTCTETGLTEGKHCSVCSTVIVAQTVVDALGHTEGEVVVENNEAPTCTVDGSYDNVVYCTVCDVELSRETITAPASGHNYNAVVTAPTCTEGGYTTYTCKVEGCGNTYTADKVAATGHSYTGVETLAPTCSEAGVMTYTCTCGDTYTKEIDALGHSYNSVVTAPTCTDKGYTTYTCSACGDSYKADEVAALGHTAGTSYVDGNTSYDADCENGGHTETVTDCTVCGEEISRVKEDTPALDHAWDNACDTECNRGCGYTRNPSHTEEIIPAVEPTCNSLGWTEGKKCSVCNTVLVDPEEIPMLTAEAAIGETKYATLADAIAASREGDTITMLCKANITENTTWNLAGKTLVICAHEDNYALVVNKDVTLTITGGTFNIEGIYGIGVLGTLNISGGTFQYTGNNDYLIGNFGTTTISGGQYFGQYSCVNNVDGATLNINGGTFYTAGMDYSGEYDSVAITANEGVTITAGAFSTKPEAEFVLEGKCVKPTADGMYMIADHVNGTPVTENVVEATCSKPGSYDTVVYCTGCNEELSRTPGTLEKLSHTEVIDKAVAATCTATGLTEGKHCSVCNEVIVAQTVVDALPHTEETLAAVAPTCTATGLTEGKKCTACGNVTVPQTVVDALGHTEVIDEAVAPSCTETGLTEGKHCSVCDEILVAQTTVDALGHTEVVDEAVAPTCTETGLTEGKHCSVCNEVLVAQTVVDALGHKYDNVVTAPTCTEQGYTTYTCSVCGDSYVADYVEANNHSYETTVVDPTCTEDGSETSTCTVCGDTTTETIPATGHSHDAVVTAPTCTAGGYTTYKCSACGDSYTGDETAATSHTKVTVKEQEVPANGISRGSYTLKVSCSSCNTVLSETKVLTSINEVEVSLPGGYETVDALAEAMKNAVVADKQVEISDGMLIDLALHYSTDDGATWNPANKEHFPDNGELTVILPVPDDTNIAQFTYYVGHMSTSDDFDLKTGDMEFPNVEEFMDDSGKEYIKFTVTGLSPVYVGYKMTDACGLGHTEVTVEGYAATCIKEGLTDGTKCSICEATIKAQEVVPATGHSYNAVVTAPTCNDAGYTTYTCACGDSYTADEVAATGHDYKAVVTAPTCTVDGYTTYTCACGDSYVADKVVAQGHNYVAGETVAPTCTAAGYTPYTCTCGDTYNGDPVPATGHTAGAVVVENSVDATCTVDGSYDNVTYCTVCGAETSRQQGTIAALGHKYTVSTTEATCTENGVKTSTCSGCGDVQTETIEATGHTAGEAVKENEVAATCTAGGSYDSVVKCSDCGHEMSRDTVTVDALGHTAGEPVVKNEVGATCTADGSYDSVAYCTVCNAEASRTTVTVPATGHTAADAVVENNVDATCTVNGKYDNVTYCTVCDTELTRETVVVSANGHTAGEVVVENEKAASCEAAGSYDNVTYCTVCNAETSRETVTVPATGHTAGETVKENEVGATCKAAGSYDSVTYCTVCDAELSRDTVEVPTTDHTPGEAVEENRVAANDTAGILTPGGYDMVTYCTVCGEETSRETTTTTKVFVGTTMSLSESLALQFLVDMTQLNGEGHYAMITRYYADGTAPDVVRQDQDDWIKKNSTQKRVTYDKLAAKNMCDRICVELYNSKGDLVAVREDSIRDYAMRGLATTKPDTEKNRLALTMYADMLNYGAAAQIQFKYNKGDLANNQMKTDDHDYTIYASADVTDAVDKRVKHEAYGGGALDLKNNIMLNFMFKKSAVTQQMRAVFTFVNYHGKSMTIEQAGSQFSSNGSYWRVSCTGLVVGDGATLVTCTIYDGDKVVATVLDSIESCCARDNGATEIYRMTLRFTRSAKAFILA